MFSRHEDAKWFLKQVSDHSIAGEKSIWTEWLNWKQSKNLQMVPNYEIEWTIVGDPAIVYAQTGFFERPLDNQIQTFTHLSGERHPVFQWLTLHYIPLDRINDVEIHSPVTLFVQNKIDPRARQLFLQHKVNNLVSEISFNLPEKHQSIRAFTYSNWTVDELIQPITENKTEVQKEAIQIIQASEQYILRFELLRNEQASFANYWRTIDDCLADILNRYWLINYPPLIPWVLDAIHLVGKTKEHLEMSIEQHHTENIIKEINEWSQQIAQLDPRFKH